MKPRLLPTNICQHPDGLLVRVDRRGVVLQCLIPKGYKGDALAEAIRRRDHFLKLAGPAAKPTPPVRSNTGILGVSETTLWRHSKAYPAFSVDWYEHGHHHVRRIRFGDNGVDRETALQEAVALRRAKSTLRVNPMLAPTL